MRHKNKLLNRLRSAIYTFTFYLNLAKFVAYVNPGNKHKSFAAVYRAGKCPDRRFCCQVDKEESLGYNVVQPTYVLLYGTPIPIRDEGSHCSYERCISERLRRPAAPDDARREGVATGRSRHLADGAGRAAWHSGGEGD